MSLTAYKLIAPVMLAVGIMVPAVSLWYAGSQTDWDKPRAAKIKPLHWVQTSPVMVPDSEGKYRMIFLRMQVKDKKQADRLCNRQPWVQDVLRVHLADHPEILQKEIGLLLSDRKGGLKEALGKSLGRNLVKAAQLMDVDVRDNENPLESIYVCHRNLARLIS